MPRPNIPGISGFAPQSGVWGTGAARGHLASGYGTDLYPGDPVIRLADGSFTRQAAVGGAGSTGICVDILGYRDATLGTFRRNGCKLIPASTTYTADQDRSQFLFIPHTDHVRYVVKTNAAVASMAALRLLVGLNVDLIYSGADTGLGISGAQVDIANAATTNTLQYRIEGVLDDQTVGNDPTLTNFMVIVTPNVLSGVPYLGAILGI
jgi:hypothetical protein